MYGYVHVRLSLLNMACTAFSNPKTSQKKHALWTADYTLGIKCRLDIKCGLSLF